MSFKKKIIEISANLQKSSIEKSFPLKYCIPVYHTVSDDYLPHLKHIINYKKVDEFEKDLDFLNKNFQFVNWDEFKDFQNGNFKAKKKVALLTFDDGLAGFHDVIAPILERKGIYAINFINPKFIDNQKLMYRCKASLLVDCLNKSKSFNPEIFKILETDSSSKEILSQKILGINFQKRNILDQIANTMEVDFNEFLKNEKPYLTSNQLKTLSEKGFGISNHGWNHPLYKDLKLEEQLENTSKAADYLRKNNFLAEGFAFPFTDFGIKNDFFEGIFNKEKLFCTFGCAGIKIDSFSKNFQRIPMENGKKAEQTIKEEIAYYNLKKIFNKNLIHRK